MQTWNLLGPWAVSGARVDELELAGGQLAELAASPVDTTSTAGETLGVVSGVGPGLGDGSCDVARVSCGSLSVQTSGHFQGHGCALYPLPAFPSPGYRASVSGELRAEADGCVWE